MFSLVLNEDWNQGSEADTESVKWDQYDAISLWGKISQFSHLQKIVKTINKTPKTNKRSTREEQDNSIFTISIYAYTFMIIVLGLGK